MYNELKNKNATRLKRLMRVRKRVRGTSVKPRLTIFRSNQNLYVQVIDDSCGKTLAGIGTNNKALKSEGEGKTQTELSTLIGSKIGAQLKEQKIESVVFDRGSYKYHGVVAALADAVRDAGIRI